MKTIITYYGGKQKLLPEILPIIPDHSVYTESFAGGLAVFFAKPKVQNEIINDNDFFIVNFYAVLQNDFISLKELIQKTPYARNMFKVANCMYKMPHLFTDLQRAWAFFVLTNAGFSGRIGSFGCFTHGSKAHVWEQKKELLNLELLNRLKGVQFECKDALEIITRRDSLQTFHFVDPPYFNSDCGHYSGYSEEDLLNF